MKLPMAAQRPSPLTGTGEIESPRGKRESKFESPSTYLVRPTFTQKCKIMSFEPIDIYIN